MSARHRTRWADAALGFVLFVGSVAYLARWPHDLFEVDESLFLYESRRLLEGARFYRDMFEIITPGAFYLMAGLFRLFGTSIVTARMAMAVVHALVVVLVFTTCRLLGVRRLFAAAAGIAHVAIFFYAWPQASPHWISTLLIFGPVVGFLAWPPSLPRALALGIVSGALIAVQQQRGVTMAAGVGVCLVTEHLAMTSAPWRQAPLVAQVAAWAAGLLLVLLPTGAALVATAGAAPVFDALVAFPLFRYRVDTINRTPWGFYWAPQGMDWFVLPEALRYAPVVVVVAVVRVVRDWIAGSRPEALRRRVCMTTLAAFALAAVAYHPDYYHLAYAAPPLLPIVADTLEGLFLASERRMGVHRLGGVLVALVVLAVLGRLLDQNLATRRRLYPYSTDTAVGRIDFTEPSATVAVNVARRLASMSATRELFAYPFTPQFYLLTATTNPTRYQVVFDYTSPEQRAEIIRVLEERQVPLVVVSRFMVKIGDPIWQYVTTHYRQLPFPPNSSLYWIYQRLADAHGSSGTR